MMTYFEESGEADLQFELSLGHRKGWLNPKAIREMCQRLMRVAGGGKSGEVKKIEVAGENEDGERDVFDLLDLRLRVEDQATLDANRVLTYPARRGALNRAWDQARDTLMNRIRPKRKE